ncbi:unnamed protein product [Moneuplotes crassus]|uniref:Calmodulin n=1 Tax=Euplotes crassus TaxID=5936 RepID=A0AAD2CWJ8_EUPCR|nr:unnamed protein product [Moneuplotes crassus]
MSDKHENDDDFPVSDYHQVFKVLKELKSDNAPLEASESKPFEKDHEGTIRLENVAGLIEKFNKREYENLTKAADKRQSRFGSKKEVSPVPKTSLQNFGNNDTEFSKEDTKEEEKAETQKNELEFDEFIDLIKESCNDKEQSENYLVHAFSMFDRKKKGYIDKSDLSEVFSILGETVGEDEVNTMIKIAGVKSNDKINFKEFCDFFHKID